MADNNDMVTCPSAADLRRFHDGTLTRGFDIVERHVKEGCSDCGAKLDKMSEKLIGNIPGHTIIGVIDHGGQGIVFKAQRDADGVIVAVKKLKHAGDPKAKARFDREKSALGRMKHPNVVKKFGEGADWYSMEFLPGGSVEDRLKSHGTFAPKDAARLVLGAAKGIEHAHDCGNVHRDIKPANILIFSERQAKITDFGLVDGEGHPKVSEVYEVVGTPEYMSPEQHTGGMKQGTATDIYALGVVLYEMTTGKVPFSGLPRPCLARAVRKKEPAQPNHLDPTIPEDLAAITMQCLEKGPRNRPSVTKLIQELTNFVNGDTVNISIRRNRRWYRRNRVTVNSCMICAVTAAIALPILFTMLELQDDADRFKHAAITSDREASAFRLKADMNGQKADHLEEIATGAQEDADQSLLDLTNIAKELRLIPNKDARRVSMLTDTTERAESALIRFPDSVRHREMAAYFSYQLGLASNDVGSIDKSARAFDRSIELTRSLHRDFGDSPDLLWRLLSAQDDRANLPLEHIEEISEEDLAKLREYAAASPQDEKLARLEAKILHNRGLRRFQRANNDGDGDLFRAAIADLRRAAEVYQALSKRNTVKESYRRYLAGTKQVLASAIFYFNYHGNSGQSDWEGNVIQLYEEAVALMQSLSAKYMADPECQLELAMIQLGLANVYADLERLSDAESIYDSILPEVAQLVDDFPSRTTYQKDFAISYGNWGRCAEKKSDWNEAANRLNVAVSIHAKLAATLDGDAAWRLAFRKDCGLLAEVNARMGQHTAAAVAMSQFPPKCRVQQPDYLGESSDGLVGLVGTLITCYELAGKQMDMTAQDAYVSHIVTLLDEALENGLFEEKEFVEEGRCSQILKPIAAREEYLQFKQRLRQQQELSSRCP